MSIIVAVTKKDKLRNANAVKKDGARLKDYLLTMLDSYIAKNVTDQE